MSQKRIAPSHPPVTNSHSLEVDHSIDITPSVKEIRDVNNDVLHFNINMHLSESASNYLVTTI